MERALAILEVQNVMSKHAYFKDHYEELHQIWVSPKRPYVKTATWTNPEGIQEGMDIIIKNYAEDYLVRQKKALEEINKIYPEIKVTTENYGIGTWGFSSPTNPVVEIAGDGKTAKGMWQSNGPTLSPTVVDGKLEVHSTWFWRTHMMDFAKEDGQWKIWYMNIIYDITRPLNVEYGIDYTKYRPAEGGGSSYLIMSQSNSDPYNHTSHGAH